MDLADELTVPNPVNREGMNANTAQHWGMSGTREGERGAGRLCRLEGLPTGCTVPDGWFSDSFPQCLVCGDVQLKRGVRRIRQGRVLFALKAL